MSAQQRANIRLRQGFDGQASVRPYIMKYLALLFDFNGLIVDDEAIHLECFQRVLAEEGISLSDEDYWKIYVGFDDRGVFQVLYQKNGKHLTHKTLKGLIQKKNALYLPLSEKKMVFFPGVIEFIQKAKANHLMAIVSGALRMEIDLALKKGGIDSCFPVVVSAEDTKHGKPDPEGYVTGLARLKKMNPEIRPENCLAFEDSLAGIEAAHRVGMKVAALPHTYPRDQLTAADFVWDSFETIPSSLIS